MSDKTRQWLIFLLVVVVTGLAAMSYCRGDESWRRPSPRPTVTR